MDLRNATEANRLITFINTQKFQYKSNTLKAKKIKRLGSWIIRVYEYDVGNNYVESLMLVKQMVFIADLYEVGIMIEYDTFSSVPYYYIY